VYVFCGRLVYTMVIWYIFRGADPTSSEFTTTTQALKLARMFLMINKIFFKRFLLRCKFLVRWRVPSSRSQDWLQEPILRELHFLFARILPTLWHDHCIFGCSAGVVHNTIVCTNFVLQEN
jgi:hypothetical protein